ncbi:ABC transporter ATP-binding protein [Algoriphagus zhangzhouensis]|uniref:ABC-type multidrug transport system, ATPase component n=1 Tax=Algoriphagus zhangzhouensis TaxID=1073327 RepID=A0A1M7ZGW8_9BACT|nr:ATP-binding cassette domain-containing protein [Algoriphagus zhangzhouensis]TDY44060.1 ABC-type multidrug transport system ATPase subunit [Algoriphagus zhangzhouensis]SHO64160.1 ABC-type multidrug transport system, ATPase component [Algoriphagus zhangzhouensis]
MLKIQIEEASKRFQYEWIFKNLNLSLQSGDRLAVTGSNGSGKSTLLKCLAGSIPLSSGKVSYNLNGAEIPDTDWFKQLTIAAPYLELPEEFTLEELLDFHFKFKSPKQGLDISEMLEILYLSDHRNKLVSQFSSGMKQRVKLGISLFSDVSIVFLDEPTTNLDKKGVSWYLDLVEKYTKDQILMICSNEPREFEFCQEKLVLEDYK